MDLASHLWKVKFVTVYVAIQIKAILTAFFNPLSPKSDKHQISPCYINALYKRVVMRIMDMITQDEFASYFINFSPLLL